jgi:hypothetical protein
MLSYSSFYEYRRLGVIAISTLLWDVGLVGLPLYLLTCVGAYSAASKFTSRADPGLDRVWYRTSETSVLILIAMPFASGLLFLAASIQVLMGLTLGMIAWQWRFSRPI